MAGPRPVRPRSGGRGFTPASCLIAVVVIALAIATGVSFTDASDASDKGGRKLKNTGASGQAAAKPRVTGAAAGGGGGAAVEEAAGGGTSDYPEEEFGAEGEAGGEGSPHALLDSMSLNTATQASGLRIREVCSRAHSKELAKTFVDLTVSVPYWTACGDTQWIDRLHELSPRGPKTFMDVGCNKGYTSAKLFGLWAPELGFNPKAIHAKRPEVWCGNCGDCKEEVRPKVAASKGAVSVYCLEPSQTNFASLIKTRDLFFKDNLPSVQWFTMNMAMSNATGVARFSRECPSEEQCGLNVAAQRNSDLIDTSTVDAFLHKYDIASVDVLKIDTEGFDATVIMGAMESIARGRIGVISFEYHEVGVWREYSLRQVVGWLDGFNYVCYFDGKPSYARLTGCWDDAYEIYAWSNVVCVPRTHALYPEMEKESLRHKHFPAAYFSKS